MRLGTYTHRLTLSQPDSAETSGYADVVTRVPASITTRPASSEQMAAGGPLATGVRLVTMHYREDVRADWRLTDEATQQTLQVVGYGDVEGRRRELQLTCQVVQ